MTRARQPRRWMAMVTDPELATVASSFETRSSRLTKSVVPLSIQRPARPAHGERGDRNHAREPHRTVTADMVSAIVEISPSDIVKRQAATWPGMAAEIVQ